MMWVLYAMKPIVFQIAMNKELTNFEHLPDFTVCLYVITKIHFCDIAQLLSLTIFKTVS